LALPSQAGHAAGRHIGRASFWQDEQAPQLPWLALPRGPRRPLKLEASATRMRCAYASDLPASTCG
jgi:hypothetical protein